MAEKLIECVPNFSEGQRLDVIDQITAEIKNISGVRLLDVDSGFEMNRTVVTFIDRRLRSDRAFCHWPPVMCADKGSHPRMGATMLSLCTGLRCNGGRVFAPQRRSGRNGGRRTKNTSIPL
jgi:glutamate formiminotransferase